MPYLNDNLYVCVHFKVHGGISWMFGFRAVTVLCGLFVQGSYGQEKSGKNCVFKDSQEKSGNCVKT